MRVQDVMSTTVHTVTPTTTADVAWNTMRLNGIRHLVVYVETALLGLGENARHPSVRVLDVVDGVLRRLLLGELDVEELLSPFHLVHVLDAHDTTTPVSTEVGVLVEARLEGLAEVLEVRHVL